MTSTIITPKAYRPGSAALLPGEYIECDKNGHIHMKPSIKLVDVRAGEKLPEGAAYWVRYGRLSK